MLRNGERLIELVIGAVIGRLLIAGPTGETFTGAFSPLVDWRWLFALAIAPLLMVMVELIVNPHALD